MKTLLSIVALLGLTAGIACGANVYPSGGGGGGGGATSCGGLSDSGPFCSATDAVNLTGTLGVLQLPGFIGDILMGVGSNSAEVVGIAGVTLPTPIPSPTAGAVGVIPEFRSGGSAGWRNDYTEQLVDIPFEITGVPGASAVVGLYPCNRSLSVPANFTSTTFPLATTTVACVTAPSQADTYTLTNVSTSTTIGTITINTDCAGATPTSSLSASAGVICLANQVLQLTGPATNHFSSNPNATINVAAETP